MNVCISMCDLMKDRGGPDAREEKVRHASHLVKWYSPWLSSPLHFMARTYNQERMMR